VDVDDFTIDWSRSVMVDGNFDEELLKRVSQQILLLRQQSDRPITVGISSNGGALSVLESLLALLRGPDQNGRRGRVITVVTDHAYSAGAMLLSRGDYAVALPHSKILFHDVRFMGLEDVTPGTALTAAKSLQLQNERASLRLADAMFERWVWAYIDANSTFEKVKAGSPEASEQIEKALNLCMRENAKSSLQFDLHGFMVWIFSRLRTDNERLILNAVEKLVNWNNRIGESKDLPKYNVASAGKLGTMDAALSLYRRLTGDLTCPPFGSESFDEDLHLFLIIVVNLMSLDANRPAAVVFELALRDFLVVKAIDDPAHLAVATVSMERHLGIFFKPDVAAAWAGYDDAQRKEVLDAAAPDVKVAWLLCVLVARELFNGDHRLMPTEALALGLIDEVAGDTTFESRKSFMNDYTASLEQKPMPLKRVKSAGSRKMIWRRT